MWRKFTSRKFLSLVAGIGLSLWKPDLAPILKLLVPSYMGAEGVIDAVRVWRAKP